MERGRAEQRMGRAGAEILIELGEVLQVGKGGEVGVDTKVETGAVGGAAGDGDFEPGEAFVGQAEVEAGGFGDDGGVGAKVAEDLFGAEAGELFVGHGGEIDIAGEGRQGLEREDGRGERPFHVIGTSAVEAVAFDVTGERSRHLVDADGVHMGVEHEAAPTARAGQFDDDARAAGGGFEAVDFEAGVRKFAFDDGGDSGFARGAGGKGGVYGVGLDEFREQGAHEALR